MRSILFLLVAFVSCKYITTSWETNDCTTDQYNGGVWYCEDYVSFGISISSGVPEKITHYQTRSIKNGFGEVLEVAEMIYISIRKTPTIVQYPLNALHVVPYFPYEEVIEVENSIIMVSSCDAAADSDTPTCGWTDMGGQIEDSQGFCCNKGLESITDSGTWRGEDLLGSVSTAYNSFSTAHCMRIGEVFFQGFEIGPYRKSFTVFIEMDIRDGGKRVHTFTLTPAQPIYNSQFNATYTMEELGYALIDLPDDSHAIIENDDRAKVVIVEAELLGDFSGYFSLPQLDNYILYIPITPENNAMVTNFRENSFLVPREEVSFDGSDCNKIGVSFSTFRNEKSKCSNSKAGDCLHNQLYHKHKEDLERLSVNANAETKYLVHGKLIFKGFLKNTVNDDYVDILQLEIEDYQNTMIYFKLLPSQSRTDMQIYENWGKIDYATVTPFESHSNEGILEISVFYYYPSYDAAAILTVHDCSGNVIDNFAPQSHVLKHSNFNQDYTSLTLYPEVFKWNVKTITNMESTNECKVSISSPRGRIWDTVTVYFDTKKYSSDYSWELRQENEESSGMTDLSNQLNSGSVSWIGIVSVVAVVALGLLVVSSFTIFCIIRKRAVNRKVQIEITEN